jgi:hypothetical protein
MTMDFVVLPAQFGTTAEALQTCDAMYADPGGDPPAEVADLINELGRMDAVREEGGFVSMWPVDASALGVILCTRWSEWASTTYTLLEMTKARGLALVDLQRDQVFDPRQSVDVEVSIANGTRLPYLTEQIVADVMADQDYFGDHIIVKRAEGNFVQSMYAPGQQCVVEYRAGGPDQHFQTLTAERALVPRLIWAWLHDGPDAELLRAQHWQRLEF